MKRSCWCDDVDNDYCDNDYCDNDDDDNIDDDIIDNDNNHILHDINDYLESLLWFKKLHFFCNIWICDEVNIHIAWWVLPSTLRYGWLDIHVGLNDGISSNNSCSNISCSFILEWPLAA